MKSATLLLNSVLIVLWFALFREVFPYLRIIFTRQEFRTNQIVLIAVLILIIIQVRKGELRPRLDAPPQLYLPALSLVLVGSALYLVVERFLDVNTLSASIFGLACYGLLGLWMRPHDWRMGLPAALILIGALPFGEHLQTFVGYPVRILTASIVRDGLSAGGVQMVGIDTILIFENSVSKIDLPCSGVKSLWTGGLFFLAATWVERKTINRRWLLVAMIFAVALLLANLTRVAILVMVGQVAGWRLLAEMLHVPLGVVGFVAACLVALFMLRGSIPTREYGQTHRSKLSLSPSRPVWLVPLLGMIFLLMALLYTPRPEAVAAQSGSEWQFPIGLVAEPWPLTQREKEWVIRSGVKGVDRWRFQWHNQTGSMIFVTSTTWRAHHRPERCFEVYGLTVDRSYTQLISPDFPVRLLSLRGGGKDGLFSAAYWLQSAEQTTDDYATRIWSDLAPQRQRWVLVTVLFDEAIDPESPDVLELYEALQQIVHRSFVGGNN
ncbi:MAG: exosortase O [Anaerolineales bacterium]|jgi:exosortase O